MGSRSMGCVPTGAPHVLLGGNVIIQSYQEVVNLPLVEGYSLAHGTLPQDDGEVPKWQRWKHPR